MRPTPTTPRSVRASTGSLFARPVVRVPSPRELTEWLAAQRALFPVTLIGTDEHGSLDVFDADLTRPALLLMGNETAGLSAAWRERCDQLVRIPITGSASSLNVASAATVVLYEAARQRHLAGRSPGPGTRHPPRLMCPRLRLARYIGMVSPTSTPPPCCRPGQPSAIAAAALEVVGVDEDVTRQDVVTGLRAAERRDPADPVPEAPRSGEHGMLRTCQNLRSYVRGCGGSARIGIGESSTTRSR